MARGNTGSFRLDVANDPDDDGIIESLETVTQSDALIASLGG